MSFTLFSLVIFCLNAFYGLVGIGLDFNWRVGFDDRSNDLGRGLLLGGLFDGSFGRCFLDRSLYYSWGLLIFGLLGCGLNCSDLLSFASSGSLLADNFLSNHSCSTVGCNVSFIGLSLLLLKSSGGLDVFLGLSLSCSGLLCVLDLLLLIIGFLLDLVALLVSLSLLDEGGLLLRCETTPFSCHIRDNVVV